MAMLRLQDAADRNEFPTKVAEDIITLLEYIDLLESQNRDLQADLQYTSDLVDFDNPPRQV